MHPGPDESVEPRIIGHAHWSVFLPPAALALFLLAVWAAAERVGGPGGDVGLYAFVAAAVVVPLYFLLAFLRYQTTRITRTFDGIWIETGWPSMTPRHVGWTALRSVEVRPTVMGGRFGAGTLAVSVDTGETLTVHDLADVSVLARELREAQ